MKININSYNYGNAAADTHCADGPTVLKNLLMRAGISDLSWQADLKTTHQAYQQTALKDVAQLCAALAQATEQCVLKKEFFITLGGDHSCAIGTWSGAATAVQNQGELGLIWIDAHMDAHTVKTSFTQNIHGMPIACLLGHGEKALTRILSSQPKIKPENLVLIGVRSFEPEEEILLKKLNVKIFYMEEVAELGLKKVILQSIEIANKNTIGFGLSVDIDAIDPLDAPGTGTTEKNGIRANDFLQNLHFIAQNKKLIGAEIAEFNPSKDQQNKTANIIIEMIKILNDYFK